MSKFTYMNFNDGSRDIEFVAHAEKFSKEQAIEHCIAENDWRFDEDLRKPTIEDIIKRYVSWYPEVPEWCDCDSEGGCYTYCSKDDGFPVWVIVFSELTVPRRD